MLQRSSLGESGATPTGAAGKKRFGNHGNSWNHMDCDRSPIAIDHFLSAASPSRAGPAGGLSPRLGVTVLRSLSWPQLSAA